MLAIELCRESAVWEILPMSALVVVNIEGFAPACTLIIA